MLHNFLFYSCFSLNYKMYLYTLFKKKHNFIFERSIVGRFYVHVYSRQYNSQNMVKYFMKFNNSKLNYIILYNVLNLYKW